MLIFTKWFYLVFGLLTIFGGFMGFLKAKSVASLIAGGISGLLLVVASFLLPQSIFAGLMIGLIVSVALVGQFLPKLMHKEFKPHVILSAVLGLVAVAATIAAWQQR